MKRSYLSGWAAWADRLVHRLRHRPNLAKGGEKQNGDNLVCFADRDIATKYAIEAIKLVDHYRFRAVMETATDAKPLQLAGRSANWAAPYYQAGSPKSRERTVLTTDS